MGMRCRLAKLAGGASTLLLKRVLRRPAANFPGKIGLVVDPQLLDDLRPQRRRVRPPRLRERMRTTTRCWSRWSACMPHAIL